MAGDEALPEGWYPPYDTPSSNQTIDMPDMVVHGGSVHNREHVQAAPSRDAGRTKNPTGSESRPSLTAPSSRRPASGQPEVPETYLATLAHELRTPLSTLQVTAELLAEHGSLSPDDIQYLVARLRSGITFLTNLVDNVEISTAVRENRLSFRSPVISVADWIESALVLLQPILDSKGQRVRLYGRVPAPRVMGDPLRLAQVMINLLSNASRYSLAGDVIEVRVVPIHERVRVWVIDHGPGIPAEEQADIFGPYVRGGDAGRLAPDGHGLGLFIVESIIALHGGTVGVESSLGHGASFWIELPRVLTLEVDNLVDARSEALEGMP